MVEDPQIHRVETTFRSHSSSVRRVPRWRYGRVFDGLDEPGCASRGRLNHAGGHESSVQEGRLTLRHGLGVVQHAARS